MKLSKKLLFLSLTVAFFLSCQHHNTGSPGIVALDAKTADQSTSPMKAADQLPSSPSTARLKDKIGTKAIMVVFIGSDQVEFAESIIKERMIDLGYKMINPEMMEKVKKDKLLWEAIKNNNATAMAKISTDYGADVLVSGVLSVESRSRFTQQWGAFATLNLKFIDTRTAEEFLPTYSDGFPMVIEESELSSKRMAVKKATEDVALKLGLILHEDVPPGVMSFSPKFYKAIPADRKVNKVKFLPDSKRVAIINDHSVEIIEIDSHTRLATYEVDEAISSIDFSKNSELVAIGLDENLVYIYDQQGILQKKLKGERGSVTSVAFNNEGSLLAVGFKDGHIELMDTGQWRGLGKLTGHSKRVHSLGFAPNDRILVSVSDDLQSKFWDLNLKKEMKSFSESTDRLFSACLSMDGSLIGLNVKEIIIYYNSRNRRVDKRSVVIRKTTTGDEVTRFDLPKDILAIAFYPNKRYIASASEDKDKTVRIWDIYTGKEVSTLSSKRPALSLDFSNDGKMLVYATDNEVIISTL